MQVYNTKHQTLSPDTHLKHQSPLPVNVTAAGEWYGVMIPQGL